MAQFLPFFGYSWRLQCSVNRCLADRSTCALNVTISDILRWKKVFFTLFVIGVSCNHPQFLPVFRFLFAVWATHRSPIFWYYIEKFGKACLHFLLKIHGQWTRCWKDIQVDRVEIACLRKWMIFTLNVWYLPVSCISSCC